MLVKRNCPGQARKGKNFWLRTITALTKARTIYWSWRCAETQECKCYVTDNSEDDKDSFPQKQATANETTSVSQKVEAYTRIKKVITKDEDDKFTIKMMRMTMGKLKINNMNVFGLLKMFFATYFKIRDTIQLAPHW